MPAEPFTGAPTEQQIEQQLARLRKHLQAEVREAALLWLINFQRRGQFDRKLNISAKEVYRQFYEHSVGLKLSDEIIEDNAERKLEAIAARVKKLFGDLADAIEDYYAHKGANDPVHIDFKRGHGGRFEPQIELRATASTIPGVPSDLTILPKWRDGKIDEWFADLEREPDGEEKRDEDLRIITSFFINWADIQDILIGLLKKGVRIKILFMNPANADLMHSRFGLREDGYKEANAAIDLQNQLKWLRALKGYDGTVEVRVSDIMPSGFVAHSNTMAVIGLMPATGSYVRGPMIKASSDAQFWKLLDDDWNARWKEAGRPRKRQTPIWAR